MVELNDLKCLYSYNDHFNTSVVVIFFCVAATYSYFVVDYAFFMMNLFYPFVIYIGRVWRQSWRTSLLNISSYVSQNAEEVSFAANGITAAGLKAFDGVLQSNIVLKTLDLSGNPIGDEGAKVCFRSSVVKLEILEDGMYK